ncbi:hypothetical protein MNEG_6718 [Monoraphidium neglectum]|uniref:Uncharacterized protein n=1 Tax=Monoraphidium neglectum TaxID=145388 RepID=A0A0D2MDI2_9CHLO|nr:hypothetical protein MNEG_6718 [Monoraphidium neglectum]KIZ01240.1 hypothetical protein MNEG_6718 [Monoraphidium neglectum]|eukprot:XP_013900259.1 hypothetical protein MNEG_6718 [Monoraphidium neglectum]
MRSLKSTLQSARQEVVRPALKMSREKIEEKIAAAKRNTAAAPAGAGAQRDLRATLTARRSGSGGGDAAAAAAAAPGEPAKRGAAGSSPSPAGPAAAAGLGPRKQPLKSQVFWAGRLGMCLSV